MATAFTGITGFVVEVLVPLHPFLLCTCAVGRGETFLLLFPPVLYDTSLMHFCTNLFVWSFLSQAKAQLVQAGNLQFGSLGAVRGDDAERRR